MMSAEFPSRTALVLGGGGSTGNAWLIGAVAGLHEAGIDVSQADVVIGTSAGGHCRSPAGGGRPCAALGRHSCRQ